MREVTAVALLALIPWAARAAGWASSDEMLRSAIDADASAFRAVADRVSGRVELCGIGACRAVFEGHPLRAGDVLKTGPGGRCDVVVEKAGRLRVLENTELRVGGPDGACGFKVVRGAVLAALETADCRVESPQASASTRDARFRLDFSDEGVSRFVVSDSEAKLVAGAKPRALLRRWWAGKAPMAARVPEAAAGALARRSGEALRAGRPVKEGSAILAGEELSTSPGGWASVALAEGFAAVLDQDSRVAFFKRDGRTALTLLKGRLYIARLRPGLASPPVVTAGTSSAMDGSDEFEISVDEHSGLADFAVYVGRLVVRAGGAAAAPRAP